MEFETLNFSLGICLELEISGLGFGIETLKIVVLVSDLTLNHLKLQSRSQKSDIGLCDNIDDDINDNNDIDVEEGEKDVDIFC